MIYWNAGSAMIAEKFPSKTASGALSLKESAAGMTVCYQNIEALHNDVRLLTSGYYSARAVALNVLALEELAKIPDPHDTAIRAEISRSDLEWPAF